MLSAPDINQSTIKQEHMVGLPLEERVLYTVYRTTAVRLSQSSAVLVMWLRHRFNVASCG